MSARERLGRLRRTLAAPLLRVPAPRDPARRAWERRLSTIALGGALLFGAALPVRGAETGERPFAVVDLHVDLSYQYNFRDRPFTQGTGQFRAAELARAGVVGVVLPLYVPRRVSPAGPRLEHFEQSYARVFAALFSSDPFRPPGCLPRAGGVATFLAFEGAGAFDHPESSRELIGWAARGVRVFGPVHTFDNELASSSAGPAPRFGLTEAGRRVLRQAAALGMALDVSHASDRAVSEILALGRETHTPVIATHSNARRVTAHPRNLSDEALRGIARTGGVVGLNFHSRFLSASGGASLQSAVAHARHLLSVMGPEHVAIGSDFEGDIAPPAALADVSGYQRLAQALVEAGVEREVVRGIMSKNALRVLCRSGGID